MASLLCAHCTRRIYLRARQVPPVTGLCVPCGQRDAARRSAQQAWLRFRDRLFGPAAEAPRAAPLRPLADLRHLLR